MKKLGEVIRGAREAKGLSRAALAELSGYSAQAIQKIEEGRTVRPNNLPALARPLGIPEEDLRGLLGNARSTRLPASVVSTVRRSNAPYFHEIRTGGNSRSGGEIPVIGRAAAGEMGKLIMLNETTELVPTPPSLEGVEGGYAVYVYGTSMEPRYFPSEKVYVHPSKPIARGDFCVVQVGPPGEPPEAGYIKRFVKWDTDKLVVEQFNPPRQIEFDSKDVHSVHLVVGMERS